MITISMPAWTVTLLCVAVFIYAVLDIIGIIFKYKTSKTYDKMNNEWKIDHLVRNGYTITRLGKNIRAEKGTESVQGNVHTVHKKVFGY